MSPVETRVPRSTTRRVLLLLSGTTLMGASIGLLVRAQSGLLPLDVLHSAVAARTGWTLGVAIIVTQALLLALYIPLRIKPGLGTVTAFVVPGIGADITLFLLPAVTGTASRIALLVAGACGFSLGVALYLDASLGVLPRDGIIEALARRRGYSPALLRVLTDLLSLTAGWLAIGPVLAVHTGLVGVASLGLALVVGPLVGFLRAPNPLQYRPLRSRTTRSDPAEQPCPDGESPSEAPR
ncbi:YitT family protein [Lentzea sp. NPDC102401]|uniref:YczE/YyaS/YitT family protein n=1 Tax=Lentzea sp. NPDC102401 TaxID=3364128 RepID=UPI0037F2955C